MLVTEQQTDLRFPFLELTVWLSLVLVVLEITDAFYLVILLRFAVHVII